jgi:hypothetical protein
VLHNVNNGFQPLFTGAKSDAVSASGVPNSSFPPDPLLEELLNLWPSLTKEAQNLVLELAKHSR